MKQLLPPDLELATLWPTLDDAMQVQCSTCADMGARIVWLADGTYAPEPCGECGAGDGIFPMRLNETPQ